MIENRQISLIPSEEKSIEFGAYTYTVMPSGHVKYEAPRGFHDDIVIAVALMAYGLIGSGGTTLGKIQEIPSSEETGNYDEMPRYVNWDDPGEREW